MQGSGVNLYFSSGSGGVRRTCASSRSVACGAGGARGPGASQRERLATPAPRVASAIPHLGRSVCYSDKAVTRSLDYGDRAAAREELCALDRQRTKHTCLVRVGRPHASAGRPQCVGRPHWTTSSIGMMHFNSSLSMTTAR